MGGWTTGAVLATAILAFPRTAAAGPLEVRALPPVDTLDVRRPTALTSVTLTWTSPLIPDPAIMYEVCYSDEPITAANWRNVPRVPWTTLHFLVEGGKWAPPGQPQVLTLTDEHIEYLGQDWHLYFGIYYTTSISGSSSVSNVVEAAYDTVPPAAATLAQVTSTHSSVTVSWAAPADSGTTASSGPARRYDLVVSADGAILDDVSFNAARHVALPVPAAPGTTETFRVTGLRLETTYHFALKSWDLADNSSPISNSLQVTTPSDSVPPATIDLRVDEASFETVTLSWVEPGDDGMDEVAAGYDLRMSTAGPITSDALFQAATPVSGIDAPVAPGTGRSLRVTGLVQNTRYHFAIKAHDWQPNWSALSNSPLATTRLGGSFGGGMSCLGSAAGASVLPALVLLALLLRR